MDPPLPFADFPVVNRRNPVLPFVLLPVWSVAFPEFFVLADVVSSIDPLPLSLLAPLVSRTGPAELLLVVLPAVIITDDPSLTDEAPPKMLMFPPLPPAAFAVFIRIPPLLPFRLSPDQTSTLPEIPDTVLFPEAITIFPEIAPTPTFSVIGNALDAFETPDSMVMFPDDTAIESPVTNVIDPDPPTSF